MMTGYPRMPVDADRLGFVRIVDGSNSDLPLPWTCDFCDGSAVFHFRYRRGLREVVDRLGLDACRRCRIRSVRSVAGGAHPGRAGQLGTR